mgnify:CR=1 FL=1
MTIKDYLENENIEMTAIEGSQIVLGSKRLYVRAKWILFFLRLLRVV